MSTYYGIKPIVGEGLKIFAHGLNINGYQDGDDTIDSVVNVNSTSSFYVSSSNVINRGRRRSFETDGSSTDITSLDSDYLNPGSGSFTFNLWFKPHSNGGYIFDKGNMFKAILTGANHVLTYVYPVCSPAATLAGVAVSGSFGFCTGGNSNNHLTIGEFDAEKMKWKKIKWDNQLNLVWYLTYPHGLAIDSCSFMTPGLMDCGTGTFDNTTDYPWWTTQGTYAVRNNYNAGDPSVNCSWMHDIDFNDNYVFYCNSSCTWAGLSGWIVKREKLITAAKGEGHITASHTPGPYGICIDKPPSTGSSGYVVGSANYVSRFTQSTMDIIETIGSTGAGDNNFNLPWGIACDENYIYIGDYGNHRIKVHRKSDLSYIRQTGSTVSSEEYYIDANDLSISGDYLYVSNQYKNEILKMNKDTFEILGRLKYTNYRNIWGYAYTGLWASGSYFMIGEGDGDYSTYHMNEKGNFNKIYEDINFISGSATKIEMNQGVYNTEPTGWCWIPLLTDKIVLSTYTASGQLEAVTQSYDGANSSTTYGWYNPSDVALDMDNGWCYVTDQLNHRIKKLKAFDLNLLAQTGSGITDGFNQTGPVATGNGDHEFDQPISVCVSASYVFVTEYEGGRRVQKFNSDLQYQETVIAPVLTRPASLRYDKQTNCFYICFGWYNRIIQRYDSNWNLLTSGEYTNDELYGGAIQLIRDSAVDDRFFYANGYWRSLIFDKYTLSLENEVNPYYYTIRTDSISTGSWHNYTFTYDGSEYKVYLDGRFEDSSSLEYAESITENMLPMRFGRWTNWGLGSYGDRNLIQEEIGAIMAYDRVLTDGEIRQNYDALKLEFMR